MKHTALNPFLFLLLNSLILAGCSGRPSSEAVDKYMNLVKNDSYAINLFYKSPSVENYSKVKNIWSATPEEMMKNKNDVEHTAKIFYVFSKLAENKYGFSKIESDNNWSSALLWSNFFSEVKRDDPLEIYLNPKIVTVDTLDYNWAAYSVTGDVNFSNFIKSQFGNVDHIVSEAAKWSYKSMSEQDSSITK